MKTSLRLAVLAVLLVPGSVQARVWFVDQNAPGPDHDGASWATAILRIRTACESAGAGDEVWVACGRYTYEAYNDKNSISVYGGFAGTETSRDQRDCKENETVVVGIANVMTVNRGTMTVDGFTFEGGNPALGASTGGLIVRNCRIFGKPGEVPVLVSPEGVADIQGCFISGGEIAVQAGGPIYLANSTITGAKTGVLSYGATIMVGNTVSGNNVGVTVDVLALNGSHGTAFLCNNIIAFNTQYGVWKTVSYCCPLMNNDVYGNPGGDYYGCVSVTGFYGNISLDPQFVDRAAGDFHLRADSPCRNAGTNPWALGTVDADGLARMAENRLDMGAFEYHPAPFTMAEARDGLRIAAGLEAATPDALARLNVVATDQGITTQDALRICRKAAGLDNNP